MKGVGNDSRPMQPLATRACRRRCPLAPRLALLALAALGGGPARAFDWQVEIAPASELFPVLDLSQAPRTADSGNGLVSVRLRGTDLPTRLRLRIDTPGLREPAVVEAARGSGDTVELRPRPDWDVAALRGLREPRRQRMRVTLDGEGIAPQTRDVEVRLHPLDEAPYFVRDGTDRVDLGWVFAAYVNPRDVTVDAVLDLARRIDPAVDDDAAPRLRRVGAVWAALERHGLRYAKGDPALSRGPTLWSQRVRLPDEVWRERRANCLDGSVLIASVLERQRIPVSIVLVPGHAFLAFEGGAGAHGTRYLETTLLGAPDRAGGHFAAALAAGNARWRSAAPHFRTRHGPDHALIDIDLARSYGIIPLAADADRVDAHARSP